MLRRATLCSAPAFLLAAAGILAASPTRMPHALAVLNLETCDEADARPAIDSWIRANELFNSHKYRESIPFFDKVYSYFGNCVRSEDLSWKKYNHMHWQARAGYYSAIASYRSDDKSAAEQNVESARKLWLAVIAAKGTAREEDIQTAQGSLLELDNQVSAWARARSIDAPIGRPRAKPAGSANCRGIVGEWRVEMPYAARSPRTVQALMQVRDLGGNNYEGVVEDPDWNFRWSFAEVRYRGPWKHGNAGGLSRVEIQVVGSLVRMAGVLEGMQATSADREKCATFVGYKICGD